MIGPLPEARFRRGFARLHPGEVLLMLTDGILERRDKAGEFFGDDRVRAIVREQQAQPAEAILDRLFDAALAWGDGRPWEDDATIVVLKRAEALDAGSSGVSASSSWTRASMLATVVRPSRRKRSVARAAGPRPAHVEDQLGRERARARAARRARPRVDGKADRRASSGTPRRRGASRRR